LIAFCAVVVRDVKPKFRVGHFCQLSNFVVSVNGIVATRSKMFVGAKNCQKK